MSQRQSTQWFNPPFDTKGGKEIFNSFGVPVITAVDSDTAEGIADALNLLKHLGYNPTRNTIGCGG